MIFFSVSLSGVATALLFFTPLLHATPSIALQDTEVGKALIAEDPKGYQMAWDRLMAGPSNEMIDTITAVTESGDNVLHLTARVEQHREEITRITHNIMAFLGYPAYLVQQKNNSQQFPLEVAQATQNNQAILLLSQWNNYLDSQQQTAHLGHHQPEHQGEDVKTSNVLAAFGILTIINGAMLKLSPDLIVEVSSASIIIGALGCYQVWRSRSLKQKNK